MLIDKSLSIAFLVSAIFHAAILLPLSDFNNSPVSKSPPSFKVTYLASKEAPLKRPRVKEKSATAVERKTDKKSVVTKPKINSSFRPKENSIKKMANVPKPAVQHSGIEIPPELPKEKEALYLDYYQSIRERIRWLVVENYPRYIACGEVCLYFALLSDGRLKEVNVVDERSSQNRLLKEIAERSVQQASPFLPFPEDLNQRQLSFNVIISFELEQENYLRQ